ncbi:S-adenosyl-L-methionine-dependent methyltransferase [Durotheca rogersii]|uniref:S-adenosyl-L-methionine-dependent methyltransferase n=1 Tax=Durotheca rogersii TaxID=419775 RepID=UPI002221273D|nr:S-adenosyl-L-methionine-dependent methyltransferase [Durotheca rogersii]KAI5857321.1 S-adenosyl-L-methionine-dependent methyltransferase [Durotheca rogersii]
MKSGTTPLYATDALAESVSKYAEAKSLEIPRPLRDYHARIIRDHPEDSNYMISSFQSQALVWLARLIGARRVLEVGVYVGYSSMVWSHAVGPEGTVTGLEFDPEYADQARTAWKEHGYSNIEVHVGPAAETLPQLSLTQEPYDIIFIDADKSGYPGYLRAILERSPAGSKQRLLRQGGVIAADNTLRRGLVADASAAANPWRPADFGNEDSRDRRAVHGVSEYNDATTASLRLDTFVCPLWDGLTLSRLVD